MNPRMDRTDDAARLALQELIRGLEDGILHVQGERVTGVNPALARMLGRAAEGLLGRRLAEFLCDAEGRALQALPAGGAIRLRDARGGLVPAVIRELTEGVYLVADHSRESRLEGEVWRLMEKLRGGRTRELAPAESALPAMVEHEIRTSSTAIRGYLQLMLGRSGGPLNARQQGYLEESVRAVEHIERLLDDLLELATPDSPDVLRVVRKPERLHELARAALEALRPQLEARPVELRLDLVADEDRILADGQRLEQVITNLVSNALKFGPEGGVLSVATEMLELDAGPCVCLSVSDQGPGVCEEEAEQIFRPFVRGRSAREARVAGVGLGLAIARKIVDAHAGTLEAIPAAGQGLFRMVLPLEPGEGSN